MLQNEQTRLVGPVLSCERDSHIQSWTQIYDWRILGVVLPHLLATCEPSMTWDGAINREVALSTTILESGHALASIYPPFGYFTKQQRAAVHNGNSEIRSKLNHCQNVMLADNFPDNLDSFADLVVYKFGGDVWRRKVFSQTFVNRIKAETKKKIGVDNDWSDCYTGFTP